MGKSKIIDWGDGVLLNRFFVYITIAMYKSPSHAFKPEFFPDELSILKIFFSKKLNTEVHVKSYILMSLLEILFISKGEFEVQEGAYLRWIKTVENNVQCQSVKA